MAGCHPVGGTCSTPGECQCNQGWGGDLCDQCTPAPGCHPVGGTCSTPGECQCNPGWGGDLCDRCTPAPGCHPVGGTCSTPGECQCNQGWGGDLCDQCTPAPGCCELKHLCQSLEIDTCGVTGTLGAQTRLSHFQTLIEGLGTRLRQDLSVTNIVIASFPGTR